MGIFDRIKSAIFGSATPAAAPMSEVDVEAVLTALASKNKQKLDWRRSIVDLMKLLDLDSSLADRKELAKELSYTGDPGTAGVAGAGAVGGGAVGKASPSFNLGTAGNSSQGPSEEAYSARS